MIRLTCARASAVIVAAMAVLVVTAAPAASGATEATQPGPPAVPALEWAPCPHDSPGGMIGGFECATATVPLDYEDPTDEQITLALVRRPAGIGEDRAPTLFLNPGGPGGPGTFQLPGWIQFFPAELQEQFNIVSWDPRGVGGSTAVQCFDSEDELAAFLGPWQFFPLGRRQQHAFIDTWAAFGRKCLERNGALLEHVSTAETARDLDLLRQAVGDDKLSYLGLSYGTFLGATYANLFPDKVGRMVLDGNVSPSNWTADNARRPRLSLSLRIGSDTGGAEALSAFLHLCGTAPESNCPFTAGTPAATKAKFYELLDRLREAPIVLGSGADAQVITYPRLLTQLNEGALLIVQPYDNEALPDASIQGWSGTAVVLQVLWEASDAAGTDAPAARPVVGPADQVGQTATVESYAGPEQQYAVACGEVPSPGPSAFGRLDRFSTRRAGVMGPPNVWVSDEPCSTWPVRAPAAYTGPWDKPTAPILVIGNTTDPSTPHENAVEMVDELANAHLLTVEGYGHTQVLNPSGCANDAMVDYLEDGKLPAEGTVCPQDDAPFAFPLGG
jgi:pimeloyl-ACP methyl ester carboxylesterase